MKYFLLSTALLAFPAWADTIETTSRVASVTLYPWGASVTRVAEFSAPSGAHEVIVPDLPGGLTAESLRLAAPEGVRLGAVNLLNDRVPVAPPKSPARQAAEDELRRAQDALTEVQDQIDAVLARATAAEEQIEFLRGLSRRNVGDNPIALSQQVRQETEAALALAQQARVEARSFTPAREDAERRITEAQRALDALPDPNRPHSALSLSVEATGGPTQISITTFTEAAHWQPVYQFRLDQRPEGDALDLERGILVSQSTDEDWLGVDLTVSTARPNEQIAPSRLYPWRQGIYDPAEEMALARPKSVMADALAAPAAEAMVADVAELEMQGATVTWHYGNAVDIRSGAEELRLSAGHSELPVEVLAEAVPLLDETAYLVAQSTNDTGQIILPGSATLYRDGAMVGLTELPLVPTGDELRLGFGPIDGLLAERITQSKSEGEQGLVSRENRQEETVQIRLSNKTTRDWPVRVLDRVPYSEQDELRISYNAMPPASTEDYEGDRGILAWSQQLKAGGSLEITLETKIIWPEGKYLEH